MEKREKIMLGVLGGVVIYAGFTLLSGPAKETVSPESKRAAYQTVVSDIDLRLTKTGLDPSQVRRVELLENPLPAIPFYASNGQFFFAGGETSDDGTAITYSGYLESSQGAIAIINGVEYERGDELDFGGYRLVEANKGFVVIERRDAATGNTYKKQIPLAVDEIQQIGLKNTR